MKALLNRPDTRSTGALRKHTTTTPPYDDERTHRQTPALKKTTLGDEREHRRYRSPAPLARGPVAGVDCAWTAPRISWPWGVSRQALDAPVG